MSHLTTGHAEDACLVPSTHDITRINQPSSSNVSTQRGRRRSTVANVIHTAETMKEKQARAKDAREQRRLFLTPAHKYILKLVADHLKLELSAVEEFIIDSERHTKIFDTFMGKKGIRCLKFYYQEAQMPGLEDCGRVIHGVTKGQVINRLFITSGTGEKLNGTCVYFLRTKMDVSLTIKNVHDEVNFGVLELKGSDGILSMFESVFSKLYQPMLQSLTKQWGDLNTTPQGIKTIKQFRDNIQNFIYYLDRAQANAGEGVRLECYEGDKVDVSGIKSIQECIALASNPDVVSEMEDLAAVWCKQIEQILAESDQMRKEADDTGPLAELEHWRQLMARFNSLLDQIKSTYCRHVISITNIARSKVMKKWKELDKRITDSANEAKDNVKYLYTLEKYCEPLYRQDPISMIDALPGLMNAIRMIHSISRYYNTSERMTSLFIKVTNQMVTACKMFIVDNSTDRLWDMARQPLMEKLQHCCNLYRKYQESFHRIKEKIDENPDERPFEFSEMYIFGKFEAFCKRLEKIITLLKYIEIFNCLSDSKIEGLEPYSSRFQQIFTSIKKKPYDVLDQRKTEFDGDFDDFRRQLTELETGIEKFMNNCFMKISSTIQALELLERFEKLKIPRLKIEQKYSTIFKQYGDEVEEIRKLYQKHKEDPPIPRNMPPVSGRIIWVRQLAKRILDPMEVFMAHPSCYKGEDAKKIIRNYNRMAKVLLEYEMMYHLAWKKSVELCTSSLQVPVLIKHPTTGELVKNFDPYIFEVIKESEYMIKQDLDIPEAAKVLVHSRDKLRSHQEKMQMLLDENKGIRSSIPPIFMTPLRPLWKKVDNALRPGLFAHTWTSLSLPTYFNKVKESLTELQVVVKQVNDIKHTRIDYMLREISETMLCDMPEKSPWSVPVFLKNLEAYCDMVAHDLNKMNQVVEDAVKELVNVFLHKAQVNLAILEEQASSPTATSCLL